MVARILLIQKKTVTSRTLLATVRGKGPGVARVPGDATDDPWSRSLVKCQRWVYRRCRFDRGSQRPRPSLRGATQIVLVEDDDAIGEPLTRGCTCEGFDIAVTVDGPSGQLPSS